jgi:UDP-N-acetylmuramyl tripeptide synthase
MSKNFPLISVLVDYAHEPESMKRLLETTNDWKKRKLYDAIVHVVSSCGKGRDDWKKPIMGSISYLYSDFSIVTTEEYTADEDPWEILKLITQEFPKDTLIETLEDYNLEAKYIYEFDRKVALKLAKEAAFKIYENNNEKQRILLISTSMGSQQTMTLPEGEVKYDEREEWRKLF